MAKSISGPQSCKVPLCDSGQRIVRGMCRRHYQAWCGGRLQGVQADPVKTANHLPLSCRFWAKVIRADGCWKWGGAKDRNGYGELSDKGRRIYAHRASWLINRGSIPHGKEIDHQCRVRDCVNPEHLRVVSRKQNSENRPDNVRNTSGYRGVSWVPAARKWKAVVVNLGKTHYLGLFETAAEAGAVAASKRRELFTNSPSDQ